MKKILRLLLIITLFYFPTIFAESVICTNSGALMALRVIGYVIRILTILAPSLLVIVSIKSLTSVFLNQNDELKQAVTTFITKFVIAVFIFFIPKLTLNLIEMYVVNNNVANFASCTECLFLSSKCDSSITTAKTREKKEQEERIYANKIKKAQAAAAAKLPSGAEVDSGSIIGQKYSLSETELLHIAYQCQCEQGSATGAAAEASLMANRFELFNKKYSNIYDYIKNSGWWAHSKSHMSGNPKVNASVLEAVRSVLVYGNRTLPLYVDEHDCFSDISKATNGGASISVKDRSSYVSGSTVIYNRYGAVYTFYTFPDSHADPFGYTNSAYSKYQNMKG